MTPDEGRNKVMETLDGLGVDLSRYEPDMRSLMVEIGAYLYLMGVKDTLGEQLKRQLKEEQSHE